MSFETQFSRLGNMPFKIAKDFCRGVNLSRVFYNRLFSESKKNFAISVQTGVLCYNSAQN
jgi:hypothetical protein